MPDNSVDSYCMVQYDYGTNRFSSRHSRRASCMFRPTYEWVPCISNRPKLSLRCGSRSRWQISPSSSEVHATTTRYPTASQTYFSLYVACQTHRQGWQGCLYTWRLRCTGACCFRYKDHCLSSSRGYETNHSYPNTRRSYGWEQNRQAVRRLSVRECVDLIPCGAK